MAVQPADQKGWAGATTATLNQTKTHVNDVYKLIHQLSNEAEIDSLHNLTHPGKIVYMPDTSQLDRRIREVKEVSKKCRENIHNLQLMRRNQFGYLTRCEQRLKLRTQRPPTELFNDRLHEALENEKEVLTASREKLKNQEKELLKVVNGLDSVLTYLVREVTKKRKERGGGLQKSVSLPSIKPASPAAAEDPAGSKPLASSSSLFKEDPDLMGKSCEELVKCAEQREAAALPVCRRSEETMQRFKDEHTRVDQRVADSLNARVAELGDVKAKLLEQQAEADAAIYDMENFVKKVTRVHVAKDTLPEEAAKHEEKVQKAKEMLRQIKSSRETLAEDIRCKAKALKIDELCKILTLTQVQLGPKLRRKNGNPGNETSMSETVCTIKPDSPKVASAPQTPVAA